MASKGDKPMTNTFKKIINELKATKGNASKISNELIGDNTDPMDSYKRNFFFDYGMEGNVIARIIVNTVNTFHKDIAQRILDRKGISPKQRMALAYCFHNLEINLGDVKKAFTENGWDIENDDFLFDGSND